MAPKTRNASCQRNLSEGEPSSNPTTSTQETINPTTTTQAQTTKETLHARIQQLEARLAEALVLNRQASIAIGSPPRRDNNIPTNMQSHDEADQPPPDVEQVFGDAFGNCTSKLTSNQHPIGS